MNAMLDNILSRLGIYDLMGVLYTETIISVTLWFINSVFDIVNLQFQALDVNGTFLFIVISYFLGLVFQEVGSFISKSIFFRKNKLLHMIIRLSYIQQSRIIVLIKFRILSCTINKHLLA